VPPRRVRKSRRWLPAGAIDDAYFRLLPSGTSSVTAEEVAALAAVFGEDGELPGTMM
jgi:hypothetical protein